jgi:hypothetical protein
VAESSEAGHQTGQLLNISNFAPKSAIKNTKYAVLDVYCLGPLGPITWIRC